jgi:hypothetical protein
MLTAMVNAPFRCKDRLPSDSTSTPSTASDSDLLSPELNESSGVTLGVAECLGLGVADTKADKPLAGRVRPLENANHAFEKHTTALCTRESGDVG